jgi:hypothetical protein
LCGCQAPVDASAGSLNRRDRFVALRAASAGTLLARAALPIRKCLGKLAQLAPWRRRSERLVGLCNDVALLAKELAKEYDPSTVAWPTL